MRHHIAPSLVLIATVVGTSVAGAQASDATVQARLFSDFSYFDSQRPIAGGFKLGQLAGHLSAGLTDHVSFFSEATATGGATGFTLEVERIYVRYEKSDFLKLSAGRIHAQTAYWNNAFHHGQWMQTSIGRPEMIRGGNPLIPIHFVGVQAEGAAPAGPLSLGYTLAVGNGRGSTLTRAGDGGDVNNSRALMASTTLKLPRATGMEVGAAYYGDRLTPSTALDVRERILSAHFARTKETPEVVVEYARVRHEATRPALPVANSDAGYAQLAYRLSGAARAWKPYARYDKTRIPATDTILAPSKLNFEGVTGGVRYDAAPNAALKLEYRSERIERGRAQRTIAASLSFTIGGGMGHASRDTPMVMDDEAVEAAIAAAKSDSAATTKPERHHD